MTAERNKLKCTQCSKEFKYDSERRRHEQSHAPEFKCKVCSKTFSFISALRRHEKQHERTGTVLCDLCDKKFRDNILLKRHIKYAHEGSYSCKKCESIFKSEPALRTHMRTHNAESERRYQCSFDGCGKKFNFAHHLKHHELTHTNTKQYFCKTCGKGFIQSHHLKTHLKIHSADFLINCEFPDCDKIFNSVYAKKRHVDNCHNKTDTEISSDCNCTSAKPVNILKVEGNDDNVCPFPELMSEIRNTDHVPLSIDKGKNNNNEVPEDLSIKYGNQKDNTEHATVNDCELAVGSCIMHDKGENCVCTQIKSNTNEDYDFTRIETDIINIAKLNLDTDDSNTSKCCVGHCNDVYKIPNDAKPEIEYTVDGTVKIKEFLDIDSLTIDFSVKNDIRAKTSGNFIPYNSCKAVLGKCIVSGNGTMGDECICAKMNIEDQVNVEEIEDITPHPSKS